MDESARYHVARKGAKQGIFTVAEIRDGLGAGRFLPTDHCWTKGMGPWITLAELMASLPAAAQPGQAAEPAAQPSASRAPAPEAPVTSPAAAPVAARPAATPAARPAPAPQRNLGWRCISCKGTFAQPTQPVSGYNTLWKSFLYFLCSLLCLAVVAVCGGFTVIGATIFGAGSDGHLASSLVAGIVALLFFLLAAGFSFMSAFEFVSAAVHHGIYRAGQPDRCPHCTSTLILRT